jgi:tRNA(fMet)-specific endonuclease VapC
MFVFDTDHLGILQRQTAPQFGVLMRRISQYPESSFFVTIVSFHEQILGWNAYLARARDSSGVVRGYTKLEGILSDFARSQVLPYASGAADVFEELRKQRIRIGTMDLRIGAIALANDMTVLTRNLIDFGRVPNLTVEDWTV